MLDLYANACSDRSNMLSFCQVDVVSYRQIIMSTKRFDRIVELFALRSTY